MKTRMLVISICALVICAICLSLTASRKATASRYCVKAMVAPIIKKSAVLASGGEAIDTADYLEIGGEVLRINGEGIEL